MENAKATPATTAQEPLYPQERYPSVVDTDDLTFELGRNVISRLNYEKLIETLMKRVKTAEAEAVKAKAMTTAMEQLRASNRQYEETNKKLDAGMVALRNELNTTVVDYRRKEDELRKEIENLKTQIAALR